MIVIWPATIKRSKKNYKKIWLKSNDNLLLILMAQSMRLIDF